MFVNNLLDKTKRIWFTTRSSQLLSQQIFNTLPQTSTSVKITINKRNSTDKTQNPQKILPLINAISMEKIDRIQAEQSILFDKETKEKDKNTQTESEKKEEQENEAANKDEKDSDESDDDSNDDDKNGGLLIPVIELVKGFIPRLVKRPQQSGS